MGKEEKMQLYLKIQSLGLGDGSMVKAHALKA